MKIKESKNIELTPKDIARLELKALQYEIALDILVEKYVNDFIIDQDMMNVNTSNFEKELKINTLTLATNKILSLVDDVYKRRRTPKKYIKKYKNNHNMKG